MGAHRAPATANHASPAFDKATGDCLALISAGTSTFDSGLLGASANGTDAYFFTRDSLVPQDKNGPTMKIYDAREGGGFPYVSPEVTCKASDECHGAASPAPGPIEVRTLAGTPGNVTRTQEVQDGLRQEARQVRQEAPQEHHKRANPTSEAK